MAFRPPGLSPARWLLLGIGALVVVLISVAVVIHGHHSWIAGLGPGLILAGVGIGGGIWLNRR